MGASLRSVSLPLQRPQGDDFSQNESWRRHEPQNEAWEYQEPQNEPWGPQEPQNEPQGPQEHQNESWGPQGPQNEPWGPQDLVSPGRVLASLRGLRMLPEGFNPTKIDFR